MQVQDYQSFLIRLWRVTRDGPAGDEERASSEDEAQPTWRGEVEHVQSGIRWDFSTLDALLAFLRDAPGAPPQRLKPHRDE